MFSKPTKILLGLMLVLLAHQNCGPQSMSDSASDEVFTETKGLSSTEETLLSIPLPGSNLSSEGGTGTGYDGKLYVSHGVCGKAEKDIKSAIQLNHEKAYARVVRQNCENLDSPLDVTYSELEFNNSSKTIFHFRSEKFYLYMPSGASRFEGPGTFEFTVPQNVYLITAVAVGGGGGGGYGIINQVPYSFAGGGGGLSYGNDIEVTPGQKIQIKVGRGGRAGTSQAANGTEGGDSSIENWIIAEGGKPGGAVRALGGRSLGSKRSGGGSGGSGGGGNNPSLGEGGGGGAGGYAGRGGTGGEDGGPGSAGTGGGGGGGGSGAGGAGGGGVGLFGLGDSGRGGGPLIQGEGGSGGHGGAEKPPGVSGYSSPAQKGGRFGGGGGAGYKGAAGGSGAVRIVWGPGRSFPQSAD